MKLPDKVYNVLKWLVLICLPAVSSAIFALGELYNFDSHYICGTITILAGLIGALIGVSAVGYKKSKSKSK